MTKVPQGVGPSYPQVVVLVGATGDLSKRKLLPGLFHLSNAGFIPGCRIIGVSLDEFGCRRLSPANAPSGRRILDSKVNDADWNRFAQTLSYVPLTAGPDALKAAVQEAERSLGQESRRLHYLSVPPNAALVGGPNARRGRSRRSIARHHGKAFRHRPRQRGGCSTPSCMRCSGKIRSSASITFSVRSRRKIFWRSALPTACSSPSGTAISSITCRSTCPRPWVWGSAPPSTKRPAPIGTWWSLIYFRSWASWPWSRRRRWSRRRSAKKKTKCSAACCRSSRARWSAASTPATDRKRVSPRIRIPRPSSL